MNVPTLTTEIESPPWSLIRVSGSESETFLQGQLTQDMAAVQSEGAWSLLLAPNSVVLASLFVTRVEGGFSLLVEEGLAQSALVRLRRFLLRTDCQLELEPETVPGVPFASEADRIERRWPGAGEFVGELTPHAFGRAFVSATISFTKGCFTGQELVGRLDARGSSVPWRLVYVAGPDETTIGQVLRSKGPSGPQGLTSWVAAVPTGIAGLGIAHRSLLGEFSDLEADGVRVETVD